MAAPVAVNRMPPDGFQIRDGFQSWFTIENIPDAALWESDVQPPGMDVGEPIDTTTHQNQNFRTVAPRSLITMTPHTVVFGYDPAIYTDLVSQIGIEQVMTVTFPSSQQLAYYGFIQSAEFSPLVDGEMPTVTLTIVPTNFDPENCIEAGPVITGAGTC